MAGARRVVVADRSPTVRSLLRRMLAGFGVEVSGEAANVEELAAVTTRVLPDAVVLDADLPGGGAPSAAVALGRLGPPPLLVVCSRRPSHSAKAFESLGRGAVAVFAKPEVPEAWPELGRALADTLRHLRGGTDVGPAPGPVRLERHGLRWAVIGASTGGPVAIRDLLVELVGSPLGVAIVQHLAAGFEDGLAQWLARQTGLDVRIAIDNERLEAGMVRLGRPGAHLVIEPSAKLRLDLATPPIKGHRPAVDRLFESSLDLDSARLAAVLLSGMGDDGANGLLALRRAGALTAVQERTTCSVAGMPGSALKLEAADLELPPREIGRALARAAQGPS